MLEVDERLETSYRNIFSVFTNHPHIADTLVFFDGFVTPVVTLMPSCLIKLGLLVDSLLYFFKMYAWPSLYNLVIYS